MIRLSTWTPYWAGVAVLGVWLAYQLNLDPLTWDSAVAVALFLAVTVPGFVLWNVRRQQTKRLFNVAYEGSEAINVWAGTGPHRAHLTLTMALGTYVEFVALSFEGHLVVALTTAAGDRRRCLPVRVWETPAPTPDTPTAQPSEAPEARP